MSLFDRIRSDVLIFSGLVIIVLAAFGQVGSFPFVDFDDDLYVVQNAMVKAGWTLDGVKWAFTSHHAANWHPLTWLSHMTDVSLYGMNAGAHHLMSLTFHLLNAWLLFRVLKQMTGSAWRSGFVAALFAVHPLHVESVVQIAQRKDLVSTFFWLLAMAGYNRYVKTGNRSAYAAVLVFFALGVLAKPMLVTLPCVLLLMDLWPLKRYRGFQRSEPANPRQNNVSGPALVKEKIPLFLVTIVACMVTLWAQKSGGAVGSTETFPLGVRITNALWSHLVYIGKILWPTDLTFFYPHPGFIPVWKWGAALLMLSAVTALSVFTRRRHPYLLVGWLWWLGTLVPVIGLVQVGAQAMADRYTYVPAIGLFIGTTWGVFDAWKSRFAKHAPPAAAAVLIILILTTVAHFQVRTWRSSTDLFEHSIRVVEDNYLAHNNLGVVLLQGGKPEKAIGHFKAAIRLRPAYAAAHNNMGDAFADLGRYTDALPCYLRAVRLNPSYAIAHSGLGASMIQLGKTDAAIAHLKKAISLAPGLSDAYNNMGVALYVKGELDRAIAYLQKAVALSPGDTTARKNLAKAKARSSQ